MVTITVDESVKVALSSITAEAILRDASGKVLGRFTPAQATDTDVYEKVLKVIDPTEIRRRLKEEGPGVGFEEVWRRIRAQESAE